MTTIILTSILSIDHLLPLMIAKYGALVYVGLFAVIFIETGLVVFPFLPGDSLLFLCGSIAAMATHTLNPIWLIVLLSIAAIVGDTINFEIGARFGHYLSSPRWQKWIKPKYMAEAQTFFDRHGSSAIFLGRFVPIIRTFIPFTAGISKMHYRKFIIFNVLGAVAWVNLAVLAGYFFGNIAIVKAHFELIMIAIIVISLIPAILMALSRKRKDVRIDAEK